MPKLKYIDKPFWAIFIGLVIFAGLTFLSASHQLVNQALAQGKPPYSGVIWQMVFLFAGVGIVFVLQLLPSWIYKLVGYAVFTAGFIMITLNAMGIGQTVDNATRWIMVGPISIQSADVVKLGLVIVSCDLLSRITDEKSCKRYFTIVLLLTGATCVLVMIGNMSTAILIAVVIFFLLFIAPIPWRWVLRLGLVGVGAMVAVYCICEFGYVRQGKEITGLFSRLNKQIRRIDTKIEQWKSGDKKTFVLTKDNFQPTMSRVAIAMGGKSPIGVGTGNSTARKFLPYAYSDYIFAIVVEESGIVGAVVLIMLYLLVLFRACYTSSRFADYGSQLMVMGLSLMITTQALIAMLVAVDLGPSTGQPLPLVAKGGTSLIITCVYFGIMMSVAREQNEQRAIEKKTEEESKNNIPEVRTEYEEDTKQTTIKQTII